MLYREYPSDRKAGGEAGEQPRTAERRETAKPLRERNGFGCAGRWVERPECFTVNIRPIGRPKAKPASSREPPSGAKQQSRSGSAMDLAAPVEGLNDQNALP